MISASGFQVNKRPHDAEDDDVELDVDGDDDVTFGAEQYPLSYHVYSIFYILPLSQLIISY